MEQVVVEVLILFGKKEPGSIVDDAGRKDPLALV